MRFTQLDPGAAPARAAFVLQSVSCASGTATAFSKSTPPGTKRLPDSSLIFAKTEAATGMARRSPLTPALSPAGGEREELATYECQRNCCGLRAEPWLRRQLTNAGPLKFIASSPGRP